MKNKYRNLVSGSFLGAALLLGATACSDDHFDIQDQVGTNGHATIWQSIQANPNLSEVAKVLQATRVMKDEKDGKATLTYAEWLDQPMSVTAWLPNNKVFSADAYLAKLQEAAEMAKVDSLKSAAYRLEYQVVNQFVKNHIALFNYGSIGGQQDVRLLNAKLSSFDAVNATFNGTAIDPSATVHSGNGSLYVLEGVSPFAYNIYDYMSSDESFSTVFGIISDPAIDKDTFWPEGSTQGAMNEKGEIVYVDSVFLNSNELLSRANALIKSEDSLYVAMIPTNNAWEATYAAVEPLFKYGGSYNYDWQDGRFDKTGPNALKFDTDSLQKESTRAAIIESMFFNPTNFQKDVDGLKVNVNTKDSAELIHFFLYDADSLISTNGTVYYNENAGTGLANPLFAGLTPIKASNGYVFAPEENRIKPEYSFMGRTETRPTFIIAKLSGCKTENGDMKTLNSDTWVKNTIDGVPPVVGEVEDDWYTYFEISGNLEIRLKLHGLAAGHYKIYAQMLPNRINRNTVEYQKDEDGNYLEDAEGNLIPVPQTPKFNAEIWDDNRRVDRETNITFNQDSVQNVVLFEDFELQKSYMRLPSGYDTFPSLKILMSGKQSRAGQCNGLSISKIVVEPIRK